MANSENVLKALKEKKQQNINSFKSKKSTKNPEAVQAMIYYALLALVLGSFKVYVEHLILKISKHHFPSFPLPPSLVSSYTGLFNALATCVLSVLLMFALKKGKTKQMIMYSIMLLFCFIGMF